MMVLFVVFLTLPIPAGTYSLAGAEFFVDGAKRSLLPPKAADGPLLATFLAAKLDMTGAVSSLRG